MSTRQDDQLASSLTHLAREDQDPGDHPTGEELVEYKLGLIAPEKFGLLQDHLVICSDCRSLLLELADFPDSDGLQEMPEISDRRVERAFRAAWDELGSRPAAKVLPMLAKAEGPPTASGPPAFKRSGPTRTWMALAAIFFLGCVGLSLWVSQLRRTVEELTAPQINVALADLFPMDAVSRSAPSVQRLEIPKGRDRLILILHLAEVPEAERGLALRLEQDGSPVWRMQGLEIEPGPAASLTLMRSSLPSGSYRFVLETAEGAPASSYDLEILWL